MLPVLWQRSDHKYREDGYEPHETYTNKTRDMKDEDSSVDREELPGSVSGCHMGPSDTRKENEPSGLVVARAQGGLVSAARSSKDERNRPLVPTSSDRSVK